MSSLPIQHPGRSLWGPCGRRGSRASPRVRRCVRIAFYACAALVLVALLAVAAFEAAVRLLPYPPGLDRPPPAADLFLDRACKPLAAVSAADGRWHLPLADADISPHLLAAVVAVEDARFESHAGVDWPAVVAAAGENLRAGRVRRGGSTLTMQLHRLRDGRPRGWLAKLEQAVRARQIERAATKRQILVEYVNRAPFGGGLVGAGAASWRYFGKPCASLSLGEAALLAGLPQNPNKLRPDRFPQAALARRHHVLARMAATGAITQGQQAEADAEPVTASWRPLPQERPAGAAATGGRAAATPVGDGLLPTLLAMRRSSGAGGTVRTTVDAETQRTACVLAAEWLSYLTPSGVTAAAIVVLDTPSADCLAAVSLMAEEGLPAKASGTVATASEAEGSGKGPNDGGPPFARSGLHRQPSATSTRQGVRAPGPPGVQTSDLDLTCRPRSTGSVLKPFIYAAAFDAGVATPATVLRDEPAAWSGYAPANYDRSFGGPVTAADALARSRNIPALLVLEQVGVERAIGVLAAAGIATPGRSVRSPGLSLAVGGADATPLEVAEGYATLARGGVPRAATLRTGRDAASGPRLPTAPVLRPAACVATVKALADRGRTAAVSPEAAATRVAWKTGTSSGHRDAWCAAATPAVTVVVWLGNPDGHGATALVGQDAAAPLALRLVAALDRTGTEWPATDRELCEPVVTGRTGPGGPDRAAVGLLAPASPRLTIVSPAAGATVVLDRDLPAGEQRVALRAAWRATALPGASPKGADGGAALYWFVDGTLLGRSAAGSTRWWTPEPGQHEVKVTDEGGRAAAVTVTVRPAGR